MAFLASPRQDFAASNCDYLWIPPISLLRHLRVERGKVVETRLHTSAGANWTAASTDTPAIWGRLPDMPFSASPSLLLSAAT